MKKNLTTLCILLTLCFVLPIGIRSAHAQITCDSTGNVVLYSNYDGGVLNINVDVNIPNLKIGIVSYEMVTINLSGPYVNNISRVEFAGYSTTPNHHCNNSPAVTSIVGAPPGTDTLIFMPTSPVTNNNGYYIIICNYSCDTSTNQGGCNTPDQIAAYFQQEFGGLLRYHFTQYGCWNGTFNISDGGNCCVSAFTPAPVALFSSTNHICPGTCTDFTNLSTNASSFQWTFAGAAPSTSTDINPVNICYSTPGSYDVSLIATGAGGSDTISLNNYITVYPYPPPQGIMQIGDTLFANQGATSYQWYFNGNLVNGATDYFYVSQGNGDYNVICTDSNGCEVEAVIIITDAVQYLSDENNLVMFPNPVSGELSVSLPALLETSAAQISVINVIGEVVIPDAEVQSGGSKINSTKALSIDCHPLSPGLYWLEFRSGDKIFRKKFIKE